MNSVDIIKSTTREMVATIDNEAILGRKEKRSLPNRNEIIHMIKLFRKILFPGYFDGELNFAAPEYFIGDTLNRAYNILFAQTKAAFLYSDDDTVDESEIDEKVQRICNSFVEKIPTIQRMLLKDVQAGFDGDPAANSKEEIIFSYPCLVAISVYRMAHELYKEKVPFIPRIMTEYAHSKTGIDINAGATIGEYFFIDHGTGVVIGETTIIGDNVKLYQGVTLGALSTRGGQSLSDVKRHPTIEDNVTIYANSTILGGQTVVGRDSTVAGNSFIVESIPPYTKVSVKTPELTFKGAKK